MTAGETCAPEGRQWRDIRTDARIWQWTAHRSKFPSPVFRRPVRPLSDEAVQRLRDGLCAIEMQPIR